MHSYWPAIFLSVFAHTLLVLAVAWGWQMTEAPAKIQQPVFIKASLIEFEAVTRPAAPPPKKTPDTKAEKNAPPKKIDLTQKAIEQARKKKAAAEKLRQQKLAKQRAEKKAKEAERAKQKAAEKKRQQQAREQKQLAQERQNLLESLAKERAQLSAEQDARALTQQAREDERLKQSYSALIEQRIVNVWSRPPSARNDMTVILKIQLVPTGEVVDVAITTSSGNSAFDRSAVQAVKKAHQFPELKKMPSRLFESQFRSLSLAFSPQDLRQ
ncbi:MAG: cell envelope integrity protein TolA [Cellvibrionaceae bacterium]|nr:cell envelope integrity protein TolA [Cellvibrionaceae bacterium]